MNVKKEFRWDHDKILAVVRDFIAVHGRAPYASEWDKRRQPGEHRPATQTVLYHFGRWTDMIIAAGQPTYFRYWTKEAVAEAFLRFLEEHGRMPTVTDWRYKTEGYPAAQTVYFHHGSWGAAAQAAWDLRRRRQERVA